MKNVNDISEKVENRKLQLQTLFQKDDDKGQAQIFKDPAVLQQPQDMALRQAQDTALQQAVVVSLSNHQDTADSEDQTQDEHGVSEQGVGCHQPERCAAQFFGVKDVPSVRVTISGHIAWGKDAEDVLTL